MRIYIYMYTHHKYSEDTHTHTHTHTPWDYVVLWGLCVLCIYICPYSTYIAYISFETLVYCAQTRTYHESLSYWYECIFCYSGRRHLRRSLCDADGWRRCACGTQFCITSALLSYFTPALLSFTGFTITKVQILTPDELQAGDDVEKYMFKQTKGQKLFLGEGPWAHVPVEHEMSGDGAQAWKVACIHT